MGFRFRRNIKIFPGIKINLGKKSSSVTIGRPGACFNISNKGIKCTVGLPGSGISYTSNLISNKKRNNNIPYKNINDTQSWEFLFNISGLFSLVLSCLFCYGAYKILQCYFNFLLVFIIIFIFLICFAICFFIFDIELGHYKIINKTIIFSIILSIGLCFNYYANQYLKQFNENIRTNKIDLKKSESLKKRIKLMHIQ